MIMSDITRVIEQVSRDRGIDKEVLVRTLEEALGSAARKKFGTKVDIEVRYDEERGEIEVFQFKDVVEKVTEPDLEIDLEEGRKLDAGCQVGDSIGTKMDTTTFGRIAAQSAKQVIIQKMKDAERDVIYESFINRKGEIINGIVQRIDKRDIIVNLGRTEAILPVREQIPKETYRRGDRIRAYILDVLHESRGPQIILSRSHPQFLVALFNTEVPEISEDIVGIVAAAREPGSRAKIAVTSNDSDIDPVGACVGMKGTRVQSVVHELKGEKIDIIPWRTDPAKFVCNALAPAEISRVVIDEANRSMEVIVPDEYLSVAIGKRGQNVRLASKLTGWSIDVRSETTYNEAMRTSYASLMGLPGIGASTADALYEQGFYSIEELANASVEELVQIKGISDKKAQTLLESANQALEALDEDMPEETAGQDTSEGPADEVEDPGDATGP
ncbi:MAG: transcription termination/antitermination protein NusA [Desulfobacterales bacterium]|nr:MAG: transcription termination/antitermination protein NusA [Desulfobacterales bacterium]